MYLFIDTCRSLWLHLGRNGVFVDIYWRGSIPTLTVPVAETKERALQHTQDQKARLITPSYQTKKEKCDQKAIKEESSSTLVDPAVVSVLGVAKDEPGLNSEEASSTPAAKVKKKRSSEELSSRNAKDMEG